MKKIYFILSAIVLIFFSYEHPKKTNQDADELYTAHGEVSVGSDNDEIVYANAAFFDQGGSFPFNESLEVKYDEMDNYYFYLPDNEDYRNVSPDKQFQYIKTKL